MPAKSQPKIQERRFGQLSDGQTIEAWTLTGGGGLELEVLTYGAIVRRLLVPDSNGELADIVLGYGRLEACTSDAYFMGETVGRVAGRIGKGQLTVDDKRYPHATNVSGFGDIMVQPNQPQHTETIYAFSSL